MAQGRQAYPSDWMQSCALGVIPGCKLLRKFGDNEAVPGTGVTTDLWPSTVAGVARRVLPAAAGTVTVTSSSGLDIVTTGTGMQLLVIEGLDADYKEISETVSMNGTGNATTTQEFFRINRMYGVLAGTTQFNQGDIIASIGGNVQAVIEALEGQTHQALFTIPADYYLLVTDFEITAGRMSASGDLHSFGEVMVYQHNIWRIVENIYMTGGQNFDTHRPTVLFPPKTETRVSAHSTSEVQMSAMFGGVLISAKQLDEGVL